jgi:hypothetical protein
MFCVNFKIGSAILEKKLKKGQTTAIKKAHLSFQLW